jgi:hypothetical protein
VNAKRFLRFAYKLREIFVSYRPADSQEVTGSSHPKLPEASRSRVIDCQNAARDDSPYDASNAAKCNAPRNEKAAKGQEIAETLIG